MFDSHSTVPSRIIKEQLFDYYSNFEEYTIRYPKYCGQVSIVLKSNNVVITRELWNIESPKEEELIEVRYRLSPSTEISYEIISDNKLGIENKMKFSDSQT